MPLLDWVAIGFEILLALSKLTVIGLSFNPNKKTLNVAKYVLLLLLRETSPLYRDPNPKHNFIELQMFFFCILLIEWQMRWVM